MINEMDQAQQVGRLQTVPQSMEQGDQYLIDNKVGPFGASSTTPQRTVLNCFGAGEAPRRD